MLLSLPVFSHFPHYPRANWALLVLSPGWVGVRSRTLWVSPADSPVSLGVDPTPQPPQVFSMRGLEALFSCLEPWVARSVSPTVVPPGLSASDCVLPATASAARSSSHCPDSPGCRSPPLLLVRMSVSLTPWLSDFHAVRFSGGSGGFLFLNVVSSSFGGARRHSVSPAPPSWPEVGMLCLCRLCISLLVGDIEHLFLRCLAVCMLSSQRCLLKSFAWF